MADIVITIPQPDVAAPADQLGVERSVTLVIARDGTMRVEVGYQSEDSILLRLSAVLQDADLGPANSAARAEIRAIVNRVFKSAKVLQQMKFQ